MQPPLRGVGAQRGMGRPRDSALRASSPGLAHLLCRHQPAEQVA